MLNPTAYATAVLYIIRRLESGSLLLYGIRREALASTLLAESSGRSYQLEQMILSLSNGSRLYLYEEKGLMDIGEQDLEGPPIQAMGKYTLMRYEIKNPSFRLIAVLRDSGTTRVVSSSLFRLTMLVNVLWIILVVAVCIYILLRVFRPLRAINEKVVFSPSPPELEEAENQADEMNRLSLAIHQYNQQLASSQKTIGAQVRQLRQAYLEQLILEQDPYIPQNQLESLEMTNLLKEYVLALIYPEDGRWGTGSEQGAATIGMWRCQRFRKYSKPNFRRLTFSS